MKNLLFFIIVCSTLTGMVQLPALSMAGYDIVPGSKGGFFRLGMSRKAVQQLYPVKPTKTYHFFWNVKNKSGTRRTLITDDFWDDPNPEYKMDVFYIGDKVIQVEQYGSRGFLPDSVNIGTDFVQVLKTYPNLRLSSYIVSSYDDDGNALGSEEKYYYDDQSKGVAFCIVTQDEEATSDGILGKNPSIKEVDIDNIIIHRAGTEAIPPCGGAKVTKTIANKVLTLAYLRAHLHIK